MTKSIRKIRSVVHLVQSFDPAIGGSLVVAQALAKAQRKLGLDATVLSMYPSSHDNHQDASSMTLCVARSKRWSHGILKLRKAIHEIRPDVIHHHDGTLWPRLATLGTAPSIFVHGHLGAPKNNWRSPSWITHSFVSHTVSGVVAISDWVTQSWITSGTDPNKIITVPNAVDFERFQRASRQQSAIHRTKLGLSTEDRILLWAGRLHREMKGLDRLVNVAKKLSAPWRMVIAGDGPDATWLREAIVDPSRVTMVGLLENPAPIFSSADAFLFTSTTEPFGLVLLEAAAAELPIINFPCVGGATEILQRVGAHEVSEPLHEDVQQMFENASRKRISLDSNDRRRFSWEHNAQRITAFYAAR